jgi:branched-chain amino acid transport system permease protein
VIDVLGNDRFLMLLMINMVAAVGMNLVYVTGQLNLGQAGFLAVGAYTLAVVDATWSWPLPLSLLAGAVVAGIVAFPIAVGANRVRGIYLIMGTLAVGEVIRVAISNIGALGGLLGYPVSPPRVSVVAVMATLAVVVALATLVMGSPFGLTMRSIFDDEDAAAAAGVATRRVKIASVVLSAAVVGVAGGLLAKFRLYLAPDEDFGIVVSFGIALYTLIGGTHSVLGALVGAFVVDYLLRLLAEIEDVTWVPAALHFLADWRFVVYGVVVMVVMAVLPEGLVTRRTALRLTAPARAVVRRIMLRNEALPADDVVETTSPAGTLLEIDGVSHRFGGVRALDEVSFSMNAGEILALVGANGAGKSTLIDVIAGRHRCQRGSIRLGGEELSGMRPEARVRAGVARTFQSVRMFGHLTVEEVVRLGRRGAGRPPPGVNDVLALVDLEGRREDLPGSLTLAEQRRLEVGRAVASAPTLVLLDEPSVGMNLEEREELADLVRGIRDRGTTVLVVDHNLDLVLGVADRVVVLDFGRVLAVGAPEEVIADPRVRAAYIGPIVPSTGVGRVEAGP